MRTVAPFAETDPAVSIEDAADDAAIWINAAAPDRSLVLASDKRSGLYVYDLDGRQRAALPVGALNNVDLRLPLGPDEDGFAVATNRTTNALTFFRVAAADGAVSFIGETATGRIEPYGICAGTSNSGLSVYVTYKDGTIQHFAWLPPSVGDGAYLPPRLVATAKLASQLEGCVVDEVADRLVVGEELVGIWTLKASDIARAPMPLDSVGSGSGLAADVEGLSIWRGADGAGWLIASAQGKNRYVVYDRQPPHEPRGVFAIGKLTDQEERTVIDEVSETDGLDIVSSVGPSFPRGLLVVQDGLNTDPAANQNFKLVDWREVEKALTLPIIEPESP